MNANPDKLSVPDGDPAAVESNAGEAKPVRRRRAPKAVVESAAGEASAVDEPSDPPAVPESDAPVKPRRRRTAAVESLSQEAMVGSAETQVASVVQVLQAAHGAASPVTSLPVAAEPNDGAAATTDFQHSERGPVDASASESTVTAGLPGDATAFEAPRGERSRRRGRRDRNRGERGEAGESNQEGAARPALDAPMPMVIPAEAGALFAQVLSGEFDTVAEVTAEPEQVSAPPRRVLAPEPEAPKLHKVLAQAGIGSRRDMEEWIAEGKVTVNGEPAHTGQRISFGDRVAVGGKPVKLRITPPPPRIIAYHKPVGEIVTNDDPQNRPTVFRRLPRLQQGKWQSVGRLDINTEGLLLFTNSGELANQLMHPRFGVEREYAVRVLGALMEDDKIELLEGVNIEGQQASFRSIADGGGEGANHWYRVVITEGRNREVRKLFDEVGLTVNRLIRIRYGTVVLPLGLKRGVWVDLEEGDVRAIRRLASGGGQRDDRSGPRDNGRPGGQNKQRSDRDGGRPNDRNRGPARSRPPEGPVGAPPMSDDRGFDRGLDDDADVEIDHSKIPNPLEQTFDKRFVQNPRSPAGGRGFGRGGGGFGAGGSGPAPGGPKKGSGPYEPDPLQTSLGFIGADAFHRKGKGGGRGGNRGGSGGAGGGGFGGGGGGGGGFSGGRRGR